MRVSMVFFASSKRIDIPPGSHEVAVVSISTYTMIQYMYNSKSSLCMGYTVGSLNADILRYNADIISATLKL